MSAEFYTKDKVDALFLNKTTDVVAPSVDTPSGKAADAYETGIELARKVDGYVSVLAYEVGVGYWGFVVKNGPYDLDKSSVLVEVFGKEGARQTVEVYRGMPDFATGVYPTENDQCQILVSDDGVDGIRIWPSACSPVYVRPDGVVVDGFPIVEKTETIKAYAAGLTPSAKAALFSDTAFSETVDARVAERFDRYDQYLYPVYENGEVTEY